MDEGGYEEPIGPAVLYVLPRQSKSQFDTKRKLMQIMQWLKLPDVRGGCEGEMWFDYLTSLTF